MFLWHLPHTFQNSPFQQHILMNHLLKIYHMYQRDSDNANLTVFWISHWWNQAICCHKSKHPQGRRQHDTVEFHLYYNYLAFPPDKWNNSFYFSFHTRLAIGLPLTTLKNFSLFNNKGTVTKTLGIKKI